MGTYTVPRIKIQQSLEKHMKKTILIAFFMGVCTSVSVQAQPANVVADGFSDEASIWLKKHPKVKTCANKLTQENLRSRRNQGLTERTTYAEYGEFIGICAKKTSRKQPHRPSSRARLPSR